MHSLHNFKRECCSRLIKRYLQYYDDYSRFISFADRRSYSTYLVLFLCALLHVFIPQFLTLKSPKWGFVSSRRSFTFLWFSYFCTSILYVYDKLPNTRQYDCDRSINGFNRLNLFVFLVDRKIQQK